MSFEPSPKFVIPELFMEGIFYTTVHPLQAMGASISNAR